MEIAKHPELDLFYSQQKNALESFAFSFVKDKDLAQELVQQVFIKIFEKGNWNSIERPLPYLFKAIKNDSIQLLQKNKKLIELDKKLHDHTIKDIASEEEDASNVKFEMVLRAIDNLPPKCKSIMLLKINDGLTHEEISSYLNISEKTIENQVRIAFKKIRSEVNKSKFLLGVLSIILIITIL